MMRPNNSFKRDHAYCHSSNRKKIKLIRQVSDSKNRISPNFTAKSKQKLCCISNKT